VDGVGFVRRDVITTVPDNLVKALLATGEWAQLTPPKPEPERAPEPERVTEPAPATPTRKQTKNKRR